MNNNKRAFSVAGAVVFAVVLMFGGLAVIGASPRASAISSLSLGDTQAAPQGKTTIKGRFDVVISDDFSAKKSRTDFFVTEEKTGKKYPVHFTNGAMPNAKTGDQVSIQGDVMAGDMAATAADLQVISGAPTSALSAPLTTKKVAVIFFNFTNDTATPYTADYARQMIFTGTTSSNAFYQETSFGKMNLAGALRPDGDVFGWYTLPYTDANCPTNYQTWGQDAETAAAADGFVRSNYTNIIHVFPRTSSCYPTGYSYGNGGALGGSDVWLNIRFDLYDVTHEMGHNFGMLHANSYTCQNAGGVIVPMSGTCTSHEYGDPFEVMGGGSSMAMYHENNYHKGQVDGTGWLDPANTFTIDPATMPDATYTIAPIEQSTGGVQSLRIPSGDGINYYYLEYRQPFGSDSFAPTDPVVNGVGIRLAPDYNYPQSTSSPWSSLLTSRLIDTTADTTPNNFTDAALGVGKTFSDINHGISVTTLSVSSSSATVRVFFGPIPCVQANPTLTITPTSTPPYTIPGTTVNYQYTLTNRDSQACSYSSFLVTPTMPSGWTQTPYPSFTDMLYPGQAVTRTFSITSPLTGYATGNYPITETAVNTANTAYQASATTNYALYVDTIPPSVPTGLAGSVQPDGRVYLSWNASTDDIGVAGYQVYRNGALAATTTAPFYYDPAFVYHATNTYAVAAFDAGGNVSAQSAPITVQETINLCVPAYPSFSITPTSTSPMSPGTAASYQFVLTSHDGSLCGALQYSVQPFNLPSGWTQTPAYFTETLSTGQSVTRTFSITSATSGYPGGTYAITELATDGANPTYQVSSTANYTLVAPPDSTPPVITISSPTNGSSFSKRRGGNIAVNSSATDASGVSRMQIFMDGVLGKTCTGTSATPCSFSYAVSSLALGTHVITVNATDSAVPANTATSTVSITVAK